MNTYGLTKQEYINLLKDCGMCTKKWTRSKMIQFEKGRKEILDSRRNKNAKKFRRKKTIFRRSK